MANASQLLEGKNYPTGNLVLPCLYGCIAATASDADVLQPWDGAILKSCDLHPTVAEARADMHHDLVRRWVTDLSDEKLRLYSISSLCDASLRRLAFPGMTTDTREKAMQWFRQEYDSTYAPPAPPTVGAVAEPPPATPLPVYAQTGLGSFLGFMANMKSVTTHPQSLLSDMLHQHLRHYRMRWMFTLGYQMSPLGQIPSSGGQSMRRNCRISVAWLVSFSVALHHLHLLSVCLAWLAACIMIMHRTLQSRTLRSACGQKSTAITKWPLDGYPFITTSLGKPAPVPLPIGMRACTGPAVGLMPGRPQQGHAISDCCCCWDGLCRAAVPGTPAPAPELSRPGV